MIISYCKTFGRAFFFRGEENNAEEGYKRLNNIYYIQLFGEEK